MPHVFTASKCVVAITRAPRCRKCWTIAVASAPPSLGSVPVPTSSSRTSAGSCRSRSIETRFVMCDEKVLRLASIDCSSPMSANTERNTGSFATAAGRCRPGLRHQREQPRGLERDCLAAGVRTGDQQHPVRRIEQHVDRHRAFEHRVARRLQLQAGIDRELGLDAVDLRAVARLGLQHVELAGDLAADRDVAAARESDPSAPAGSGKSLRALDLRARRCRC